MNRKGYTLVELLLVLAMLGLMFPLLTSICLSMSKVQINDTAIVEREIAIGQLRMALAYYDVEEVSEEYVKLRKGTKKYTLKNVNHKLMIQPGTLIVYETDDKISFQLINENVYLKFDNDEEKYWIATLPGLY